MKILYSNLSLLNIRCQSKDKTKKQCGCISIVVPSKKNDLVKWHENNVKDF